MIAGDGKEGGAGQQRRVDGEEVVGKLLEFSVEVGDIANMDEERGLLLFEGGGES